MRKNYYLDHLDDWWLPVVQISDDLNPFVREKVEFHGLLGMRAPYDSMKSFAVLGMLLDAKRKKLIKPGKTSLVEASSGATLLALTHFGLSDHFGIREVIGIMNEDVPLGKSMAPRLAGATIYPPRRGLTAVETARMMGKEGYLNLDQYTNPANAKLYLKRVMPMILKQMRHHLPTILVAPVGTGGTIIGLGEGLRDTVPGITIVGAMCKNGVEIPGMRDCAGMKDIRLPYKHAADEFVHVGRESSYLAAAWLEWAESLMAGLSSGAVLIAAYVFIKDRLEAGTLDTMRDHKGVVRILVVFHDGARPYLVDRFPTMKHEHLSQATAPKPWELLW